MIENLYLPALLERTDISLSAAVDKNLPRAEIIASKFRAKAFNNIEDALSEIDAAIIALPHWLHCEAALKILSAGKHVLVEKPLGLTSKECDYMIAEAALARSKITVGQMRRFCPAVAAAKQFLELGVIGQVKKFCILEGSVFSWPVKSDYLLRKETAGGGVLIDTGAHTLDMLLWLFGEVEALDYRDDAFGGVEADCEIRLRMSSGAHGYAELSRTRELPTKLIIDGSTGKMVVAYKSNEVTLEAGGRSFETFKMGTKNASGQSVSVWHYMIVKQLDNWIRSLRGSEPVLVPGEEGRKVVALIERCYAERKPLHLPWVNQATGNAA